MIQDLAHSSLNGSYFILFYYYINILIMITRKIIHLYGKSQKIAHSRGKQNSYLTLKEISLLTKNF